MTRQQSFDLQAINKIVADQTKNLRIENEKLRVAVDTARHWFYAAGVGTETRSLSDMEEMCDRALNKK